MSCNVMGSPPVCTPDCAAGVAGLVANGCWDSVVAMAASMGLGSHL